MSSETTTADLRVLLEQERDELRHRLAELGGLDYDANFADSSQVTAERGEAEALAAALGERLNEVDSALAKLAEGTYGTCEGCGKEIPLARLEAMPTAVSCIDCASKR
jgi:DnaK suppressor protein